ncbi:hypothetical protein BDK51DRAFT_23890, partial [Blyttiomyces helicus]
LAGNWFIWSQQPSLFQQTWKNIANGIRAAGLNTALVWSPNMGHSTISNPPPVGSEDFKLFDTNHDNVLDENDDPYLPYYA